MLMKESSHFALANHKRICYANLWLCVELSLCRTKPSTCLVLYLLVLYCILFGIIVVLIQINLRANMPYNEQVFINSYLQTGTKVRIWFHEPHNSRVIGGRIISFDEHMNLVLEEAEEYNLESGTRRHLGYIILIGDDITLIQYVNGQNMNM